MHKFYLNFFSVIIILLLSSCFTSQRSSNNQSGDNSTGDGFVAAPLDEMPPLEYFVDNDELGGGYYPGGSFPDQRVTLLYPIRGSFYPLRRGPVRVVTFLVNIDTLQAQDLTRQRVNELIFTGSSEKPFSLNSFVNKASAGSASLIGNTFGPFTVHLDADKNINNRSQECDSIMSQVKTAALAQGFREEDYPYGTIYLYMIPGNLWVCSGCGSSAGGLNIAYVGGFKDLTTNTNQNIAENAYANYALVHEFGHALGLHHDSKMNCTHNGQAAIIGDECVVDWYGDHFSSMGVSLSTTMPAIYSPRALAQLGWVYPQLVTSSGNYTVSPIDRSAINGVPQVIQIPRGLSIKSYYYISRRIDLIGETVPDPNGIFVHLSRSHVLPDAPYLLKMHPSGGTNDVMLRVGETFTDPQTGMELTLNWINEDGSAYLSVLYPARDDTLPSTPTGLSAQVSGTDLIVTWNAGTDSFGYQIADYRMTINDTVYDHVICGADVSPAVYSGIGYSASTCGQLKILLSRLTNTVPLSIRVQSRDLSGNLSIASSAVTIKIPDGPDITPPSAPTNVVATDISTNSITLSWDAATDDHGEPVTYYFHRANFPTPNTGWPLSWAVYNSPTSVTIGTWPYGNYPYLYESGQTYVFTLTPKDASGNVGQRVSISVKIPD